MGQPVPPEDARRGIAVETAPGQMVVWPGVRHGNSRNAGRAHLLISGKKIREVTAKPFSRNARSAAAGLP